jgi:7-cyano-7-deazaguanine reductase
MTQYNNASELDKLTLGQTTTYTDKYNPDLLQGVPRSLNRRELTLNNAPLPFNGEDIWYGYELSWLNNKGKPLVAVAEFTFSCTSSHMVESKAFKLYLNSYNQSRFSSLQAVEQQLQHDLSLISGAPSQVKLFTLDQCPPLAIRSLEAKCIDDIDIEISHYQLKPALLKTTENNNIVSESLVSHLLKSNCLITNQPDWATIYINYRGNKIVHSALLQYLVSFRQHNEFHEQCVERIFCDILSYCQPEELTIYARYTRRGGLDINPFRTTTNNKAPLARTLRQ